MTSEDDVTDPILIVGAGPTGLTAALELRRFGLPVRLIDMADGPSATSRALGIQARTLELLEQRHLTDEILRLGNPAGYKSIYGDGKRLVRIDFGTVRSRYNYLLMLSQAETERILRETIAELGVDIGWGVTMVGFTQDAHARGNNKVQATLRDRNGAHETVGAPWLISAEGAHSSIRTTLNMEFSGKTVPRQYMLGDVHVKGDLPPSDFHIFGSEHGFMALFPISEGHFRLIADNPIHGRHDGAPTLEEIQAVYDQRAPIPAKFHDMGWSSWFTINSRMVHHLRMGRLLLGGDAAHIHAPAGAQGMNTGMQDRAHGTVKAGDRVPELTVRYRGSDWTATRLLRLLDPSAFVLLVAHGSEGDHLDPQLVEAVAKATVPVHIVEMAQSPGEPGEGYAHAFGGRDDVFLIRPDGYVALTASAGAAPGALRAWCGKWLAGGDPKTGH